MQSAETHHVPVSFGWLRSLAVLIGATGVFLIGETPTMITPIVTLNGFFGFWLGMLFFFAYMALMFVVLVGLATWLWPKKVEGSESNKVVAFFAHLIERLSVSKLRVAIPAAGIVNALLMGPIFGFPIYRALGIHGKELTRWTVIAFGIFCPFWYSFYAGAFEVVGGYNAIREIWSSALSMF